VKVETEEGINVASAAMALRECMATVYAAQQQIWPYMKADNLWMVDSLVDHIEGWIEEYTVHSLHLEEMDKEAFAPLLTKWAECCADSQKLALLVRAKLAGRAPDYLSAEQVDSHLSQADWSGSPLSSALSECGCSDEELGDGGKQLSHGQLLNGVQELSRACAELCATSGEMPAVALGVLDELKGEVPAAQGKDSLEVVRTQGKSQVPQQDGDEGGKPAGISAGSNCSKVPSFLLCVSSLGDPSLDGAGGVPRTPEAPVQGDCKVTLQPVISTSPTASEKPGTGAVQQGQVLELLKDGSDQQLQRTSATASRQENGLQKAAMVSRSMLSQHGQFASGLNSFQGRTVAWSTGGDQSHPQARPASRFARASSNPVCRDGVSLSMKTGTYRATAALGFPNAIQGSRGRSWKYQGLGRQCSHASGWSSLGTFTKCTAAARPKALELRSACRGRSQSSQLQPVSENATAKAFPAAQAAKEMLQVPGGPLENRWRQALSGSQAVWSEWMPVFAPSPSTASRCHFCEHREQSRKVL